MLLVQLLQIALILAGAPLIIGIIRKVRAILQSRRGAPVSQPYYDLIKLFRKEVVLSNNASWISQIAPYIVLASTLGASLFIPFLATPVLFGFGGDLLVVVYLLILGTFFLALAGLDSGSAFGGMGSSREMTVVALAEPTIALAVFSLALSTGTTNLGEIVLRTLSNPIIVLNPTHLLAFAALFIAMLAETGRFPIDNPTTHLELTMIHEAMILESSGRYLALVEWASWMKLSIFLTLLANLFFPYGIATSPDFVALLAAFVILAAKVILLAIVLAFIETGLAKMRLFRVPELLSVSFVLAFIGVVVFNLLR